MGYNPNSIKNEEIRIINDKEIGTLSKNDTYSAYIEYFNSNNSANIRRSIVKNNKILFKSISTYFITFDPSKLYHMCMLKTNIEPSCKICGGKVWFTPKIGFNIQCKSCNRREQNLKRKQDNLKLELYNTNLIKDDLNLLIKNVHSKSYYQTITSKNPKLISQIRARTNYLDSKVKFNERIYHILNNIHTKVLCPVCNNELKILDINRGYPLSCSYKCSGSLTNTEEHSNKVKISKRNNNFEFHVALFLENKISVLSTKSEYISEGLFKIKCNLCNKEIDRYIGKQVLHNCDYCNIKSKEQLKIREFLENKNIICRENDRKQLWPKHEIDIFIPKNRLGIEYNGLYWHSELKGIDKNYHLSKTSQCEEKGIHLLHIFEHEWLNQIKQQIWKSIILGKLGLNKTIGARKCKIINLTSIQTSTFLETNHLQGNINSSIRIGLEYEEELVAILTISKPRYNKKYDWEITRFASKKGINVVGGFSKLLKYFRTYNTGSIITYADRRFSEGNLYKVNGFTELSSSGPNYFYFKYVKSKPILYSRVSFQKHKLQNKLEIFDKNLTEIENMLNNGYRIVYDSGNKVFSLS